MVEATLGLRHRPRAEIEALFASGAIGVVMYAVIPVALPRLILFAGFVDTLAVYDRVGYNAQETRAFVNPYAAIPSLHFGWSLLLGAVACRVSTHNTLRAFGLIWPVAMYFAVVMTANHFIVDAIAGAIVSWSNSG